MITKDQIKQVHNELSKLQAVCDPLMSRQEERVVKILDGVLCTLKFALDAPEPEPKYSKQQYDQLHAVAYNRYVECGLLRKKLASLGESNACRDIEKQAKLISRGSSEVEPCESGSVVGSNPTPDMLSDEAISHLWNNACDSYAFARAIEAAVCEKMK